MSENRIQIVITTDNAGAVTGIRQVLGETRQIGSEGSRSAAAVQNSFGSLNSTFASGQKLFLGYLAAFTGFASVTAAFSKVISESVEFNKTVESSRLGIASLLSAQMSFTTSQGQALGGTEKLNAALYQSDKILKQLQIDNLQTSATFQQLVRAYQQGLSPGLEAGLSPDQIRKVTVSMVQAAGAMGLPLDMLGEELRGMLRGTISARTTLIASALGITNEDIRRYEGDASGLFAFLQAKLEAFRVAGDATQKTFSGLWSNLVDTFQFAAGKAGEPLFAQLKTIMGEIISSMVEIDQRTKQISVKPEVLASFQRLFDLVSGVISLLREPVELVISLGAGLLKKITDIKDIFSDILKIIERLNNIKLEIKLPQGASNALSLYGGLVDVSLSGSLTGERKNDVSVLAESRRAIEQQINELKNVQTQYTDVVNEFGMVIGRVQNADALGNTTKLTLLERALAEINQRLAQMGSAIKDIDTVRLENMFDSLAMAANNAGLSLEELRKRMHDVANAGKTLDESLANQKIRAEERLKATAAGLPKAHAEAQAQYRINLQKIEQARQKGLAAGLTHQQVDKQADYRAVDAQFILDENLQDIDTQQAKKGGRAPIDFQQVDQDYSRLVKHNEDMYRQVTDQAYDYYTKLAEMSGDWDHAEQLRIERQVQDKKAGLDRMAEDQYRSWAELYQKINKEGRGNTPEAQEVLEKGWTEVEKADWWASYGKGMLDQQQALESADAAERRRLQEREQVAQLNLSYAELNGTMGEQLQAQIELIRANRDLKLKEVGGEVTELGKAYKKLYDEQERLVKLYKDGNPFEAFVRGMSEDSKTMAQSAHDAGKNLMSDLRNDFSDFFQKSMKGEFKNIGDAWKALCDLMTNAFSKALSDMVADMMTSGLKDLFKGFGGGSSGSGGSGGIFGSLLGGISGLFGGGGGKTFTSAGGATWSTGMNFLEHHAGGRAGDAMVMRMLPSALLAFAPRLHAGLAPDEYPAILQAGERVLNRRQNAAYEAGMRSGPPRVNITVNDYSGQKVSARQEGVTWDPYEQVLSVVVAASGSDPRFHDAIKRANTM